MFARGWEEREMNGELLFNGYRVSVLQDEKVDGWCWLHRNVNVLNATECILNNGQQGKFYC